MLFRRDVLDAIAAGRVTAAFRRWRRPSVRAGGRLRTEAGELAIESVDAITYDDVTDADARKAGFASRHEAIADLEGQREGTVYRIRFHLAGPDSRDALRRCSALSDNEFESLRARLASFDARSKVGPWTSKVLGLIAENESLPAGDLAAKAGVEKEWLKLNVRKLKELGLTESLQPGYRLSPRGRTYLRLDRR